jgi:hypothetical protein
MQFRNVPKPAPRPSQRAGAVRAGPVAPVQQVKAKAIPRKPIDPTKFKPLFPPEEVKFVPIRPIVKNQPVVAAKSEVPKNGRKPGKSRPDGA